MGRMEGKEAVWREKKGNKNRISISFPFEPQEEPQRVPALHHHVMTFPHSLRAPFRLIHL